MTGLLFLILRCIGRPGNFGWWMEPAGLRQVIGEFGYPGSSELPALSAGWVWPRRARKSFFRRPRLTLTRHHQQPLRQPAALLSGRRIITSTRPYLPPFSAQSALGGGSGSPANQSFSVNLGPEVYRARPSALPGNPPGSWHCCLDEFSSKASSSLK